MHYRLRNDHQSTHYLCLARSAWSSVLELAEEYGWNPIGTVRPHAVNPRGQTLTGDLRYEPIPGSFLPELDRLVLLEDALNLADALERAFLEYEPRWLPNYPGVPNGEWQAGRRDGRPGIGALLLLIDFCRRGAFWIERHEQP